MRRSPRPLLVLHRNASLRGQVEQLTTRGAYASRIVEGWAALRRAVTKAPPATLVLVDPYEGASLSGELRAFLWEFPSTTVVAALRVRPGCSRDLRMLGQWGVADVVSLGEEDTPEALARRLQTAQARPLQSLLERTLPPSTRGHALELLMTCAEVVAVGGKGRDLARRLHLSERSVLRWTERLDLPPPRRLLAWMRILLAASLLDDPGRTVRSVACACGYASDSSLRRAMQDFLGTVPTALRSSGALETASAGFTRELVDRRLRKE